jgi:general secretion pathway protein I
VTRRRQGFSLIEALVALTIAAMVLGAIFELQLQMVRGQRRATEAMDQVMAQENALALTRNLNPMERPEGVITLPGGDTIRWTSQAKGRAVQNAGFPSGDGMFMVQLFTLTVQVERVRGTSPAPMVFDRMGWRRLSEG